LWLEVAAATASDARALRVLLRLAASVHVRRRRPVLRLHRDRQGHRQAPRHNRPKTGQSSIESSSGHPFLRRNLGLSRGFNVLLCPTCSQRNVRPERAPWIRFEEIRYPGEGQVRGLEGTRPEEGFGDALRSFERRRFVGFATCLFLGELQPSWVSFERDRRRNFRWENLAPCRGLTLIAVFRLEGQT